MIKKLYPVLLTTISFSLISCSSSEANIDAVSAVELDAKSICGTSIERHIQIELISVFDGLRSVDSFRFNEEGLLSHAAWQSNGTDVVSTSTTQLGVDAFLNLENLLSDLTLEFPPDDGTLRQPGGFTFRATSISADSIEFQAGSLGGDSLLAVIDGWRAESTLSSVTGDFSWVLPLGEGVSTATAKIDMDALGCEHPVSQAIIDGLASDTVLTPASEELSTFLNDISAASVYLTSTPVGAMYIGVVPIR